MAIRYLVPDCSVVLAAYFDETIEHLDRTFDLSKRARPIRRMAHQPHVSCFAPDLRRGSCSSASGRTRLSSVICEIA